MISLAELARYCAELLVVDTFEDYCPNGLQVEGRPVVKRIVTGVTASQALIDAAIASQADALLVHHGYFWRGEDPCLVGIKGRRIGALLRAGLSLLAYHLALDAHAELGNNAQLARYLEIIDARPANPGASLLWRGSLRAPMSGTEFDAYLAERLQRQPLRIAAIERPIRTLAWCSGGAQRLIGEAAALGVDAYLSGEISESTTHQAREYGLDYFALGHHASERYGIAALGEHLAQRFGLVHRFIDVPNPA